MQIWLRHWEMVNFSFLCFRKFKGNAIFFSTVTWINADSRQGFVLHYPAIAVHAATGANEDFPEPCLFLMIDLSKTGI
jgi:hypothetical protein